MSELVSMAQAFSGLPMNDLIGGPLNAAANANSSMAMTQTKFMLDTCFNKVADDKNPKNTNYQPIMIKMVLSRGVVSPAVIGPDGTTTTAASIKNFDTTFNLPLLTIIPLNSLAVETADVAFEMEVKSSSGSEQSSSKETSTKVDVSFEAKFSAGPFSASVKGNVSHSNTAKSDQSSHYEKSNSAKYTVNVHAGQLPLPRGVNVIIDAFTLAIQPLEQTPIAIPK